MGLLVTEAYTMGRSDLRSRMLVLVSSMVFLSVAALAACSTAGSSAGSEAADEDTAPGATIDVEVRPGTADDGFVGARIDVTDEECEQDEAGGWQARGLVTNSTDADADYRIYVSFLDGADDTRGLTQADVTDLAPGDSEEWEAELALPGEDDLRCVLRVERVGEGNEDAEDAAAEDAEDAEDS
jgi:hypothetical protein